MALGFREIVEANGVQTAGIQLYEIAVEKKKTLKEWGLRELHEAFCGDNVKNFLDNRLGYHPAFANVQEADVQSSAFSNIVGVLLTNEVIAAYDAVPKIGDQLVKIYKTKLKEERVAGFTPSDDPEDVNEDQEYPGAGLSDKYVTLPDPKKKGKVIYITEEAIFYDQTAQIIERAQMIGERIAETREKRIISGVCGGHQCYRPAGILTSLYGGTPQLVGSNALVDYTDLEKCELEGLGAMVDEHSNKISVRAKIILVPRALWRTALRILNTTQVTVLTGSNTIDSYAANPYKPGELVPLMSDFVSTYTSNSTSWFMGDPQKQFRWKEVYPIQTFRLMDNSLLKFQKDVEFAYKVRYKGDIFAIDNKYFCKNNA